MKIYYYLFYRFSSLLNKNDNNKDAPVLAISGIVMLNFVVIYTKVFGINENYHPQFLKFIYIIIIVCWIAFNYYLFLYKNKYKKIIKKYQNESASKRRVGNIFLTVYIILSILLFFYFSYH
jgi:uncharacterized membrane protein